MKNKNVMSLIFWGVIIFVSVCWLVIVFKWLSYRQKETDYKVFNDDEFTYTTRFENAKVKTQKEENEEVNKIFNE